MAARVGYLSFSARHFSAFVCESGAKPLLNSATKDSHDARRTGKTGEPCSITFPPAALWHTQILFAIGVK